MKSIRKRIISVILAAALILTFSCPVFAAEMKFDDLASFGGGAITISSDSISRNPQDSNLPNYGSVAVYTCTAPVTITYEQDTKGVESFYVCSINVDKLIFGDTIIHDDPVAVITEPGTYFASIEMWDYPVKLPIILDVKNGNNQITTPAPLRAFSDVPSSRWSHDAIMDMVKIGMFTGTTSPVNGIGTFNPAGTMTRAQFLAVVTRYLYQDELKSMASGNLWYDNNYNIAVEKGLISKSEFRYEDMNNDITRQEMALIAVRAAKALGQKAPETVRTDKIADYDTVDAYYKEYVLEAFSMGLISGYDDIGTFGPKDTLTREQGAMIAYRLVAAEEKGEVSTGTAEDMKFEISTEMLEDAFKLEL